MTHPRLRAVRVPLAIATAISLVIALLAVVLASRSIAGPFAPRHRSVPCPTGVLASPRSVDAVTEAAWRLLVDGRTVVVQGKRERFTRQNSPIIALVRLVPEPTPGADALRRTAQRRCGRAIALRAWAVVIVYSRSVISGPETFFVVKTKAGWRAF